MYSADSKEMLNLFFGGIAQYTDSAGVLVRNDNVPFVKTIAKVSRDRNGRMTENFWDNGFISLIRRLIPNYYL